MEMGSFVLLSSANELGTLESRAIMKTMDSVRNRATPNFDPRTESSFLNARIDQGTSARMNWALDGVKTNSAMR
jgi:hypothetical protein